MESPLKYLTPPRGVGFEIKNFATRELLPSLIKWAN